MTTATRRRPTPADVARIAGARHRAQDLIAPAAPAALGEPFRPLYERGLADARLHPHHHLVGLVLATRLYPDTGHLLEQPFLEGLVAATRLRTPQVVVALQTLESRGWIRKAHSGPSRWETTSIELAIPSAILPRLLKKK
ncbi:hypothetical protein AB0M87_02510 [Streptomyces sp. NPDC051320]|uniref:hypothetical protein n=1 Tax=Streptomyces sp. NPDC051320 TaxID=3154644 RepID=UPI00344AACEA